MGTTTTRLSLNKPTVGGDTDAWGALLNAAMDILDEALVQDYGALQTLDAPLGLAAGSAADPGLAFSADTDTGFFRPGANALAGTVGGAEVFRLLSTENIVIGATTDTGKRLQVVESSGGDILDLVGGTAALAITNPGASRIDFDARQTGDLISMSIQGVEALRVANTRELLIGTTTVTELLSLGGRAFLEDSTAPGTPTGGGVVYVESGALKYKGSSGTVTTLGVA